ncbi:MAG: putative winged helix family two component transcriptional regulator, partial [Chloroflexi bacterium OLB15]
MIQGNDSFRLIVRRGPQPNQSYELNKDIVTLGRDITNDIVINDPEVSRHHLRLSRGAGGFTIEDLGSTNGTFINGQRLTGPRPLRPGDMVGLGETVTLAYEAAASPMTAADAPPAGTMLNPAQRSQSMPPQPAAPSQPMQPPSPQPYAPASPQPSPYAPPQGYPPPGQPTCAAFTALCPNGRHLSSIRHITHRNPYAPSTGYTGAQPSSPYG